MYKSVSNTTIIIYDFKNKEHILDYELSKIPSNIGKTSWNYAAHWKRVHTLTGILYQDFVVFHKYMMYLKVAKDDSIYHYKKEAEDFFKKSLKNKIDDFVREINKLPNPVSNTKFIRQLKKIPLCYPPIMQSLASDGDVLFYGLELADLIANWLINALRRADMVLEKHFDEIKSKKYYE